MKKGIKAEIRVANYLKRKGAKVVRSPGSRGSADLIAKWPSGREWLVQVKYSSKGKPSSLSKQEIINILKRVFQKKKRTAVKAEVTPDKIKFKSVKTDRELKP